MSHIANLVFLGPSLPLAEAQKLAPQAFFLPPVKCGDILQALRLKPRILAIIDGYFEHTAAVWHKEILYALNQGIQVLGASSMGALRAAELADFGMVGIGKIFADYYQKRLNDDDEVAVLHAPADKNYLPLTDAMVNIRASLNQATSQNIISRACADEIIEIAKSMHYRTRNLHQAVEGAGLDSAVATRLLQWLQNGGYVDQKRLDAQLLLEKLHHQRLPVVTSVANPFPAAPNFFRVLQKNMLCSSFPDPLPWLPMQEKVAAEAQHLEDHYLLARRLAYLLSTIYQFSHEVISADNNAAENFLGIPEDLLRSDGCKKYDCTLEERTEFLTRMNSIANLLQQESHKTSLDEPQDYLLLHLYLFGDFSKYQLATNKQATAEEVITLFMHQEPMKYILLHKIALLWWFLTQKIKQYNLQPTTESLEHYSRLFRQKFNLLTPEDLQQWLRDNAINAKKYQELISLNCHYTHLVQQNNLDCFNLPAKADHIWWFRDALWLTGLYQNAKDLWYNHNSAYPHDTSSSRAKRGMTKCRG